jgi:hypothetical protein
MERFEGKLLTPDQLCDALEVHLGREKGQAKCRQLLTELKADPDWRAQINSLGCTVQVYQRVEPREVPEEVAYRLRKVLDLGDRDERCEE